MTVSQGDRFMLAPSGESIGERVEVSMVISSAFPIGICCGSRRKAVTMKLTYFSGAR